MSAVKFDVYEQIRILKEIGVRRTFINAKHPQIDEVLRAIQEAGLICDNLHSEYAITQDGEKIHMDDVCKAGKAGEIMVSRIMKNIDTCAKNNIPLIVVHPSYDPPEIAINEIAADCGHEYSRLADHKPMPLFRDRLAALHIHDNFITNDDHLIPFTGKADFEYVGKELAKSDFNGTLMLEILYGKNEKYSSEPTYKAFALKAKHAAENVIDIVEKYRNN